MDVETVDLVHKMTTLLTETHAWISAICRQFADATGWPLEYTHVDPALPEQQATTLDETSECCWVSEVHDGEERIGFLHISLPEESAVDRSFLTVCRLAEIFSDLLNKFVAASTSLESTTSEVSTLDDIGLMIPEESGMVVVLDRLLQAVVRLTGYRSSAFYSLDPSAVALHLRAGHQLDSNATLPPFRKLERSTPDVEALLHGRVLVSRDGSQAENDWLPEQAMTALCVPVKSQSGPIGTLWAYDRRQRTPSEREAHVLESIAARIASVLERVVLLRESTTQHRLQRDLEVASANQSNDIQKVVAADIGFDVAAVCTSRYELGGDLCELIRIDENRTVIAVGDAAGDSIPAAMVMSCLRGALRAVTANLSRQVLDTENVMQQLNRTLHSVTPSHQFMSLVYGVLDGRDGTFTYTNAGHPTPIHAHDKQMMTLKSHGMLLGVMPDTQYDRSVIQLSKGDLLVLYSDGVSEAMNQHRKMFRSQGIVSVIESRLRAPVDDVFEAIWSTLETHVGGGKGDDRTLMVVKRPE